MKVDELLNLYQTDTEHILYNSKEAFVLSLHLNVSFRLESYATEAFEIDILSLSSFPSLFFFLYFSFATSRYTISLGCCFYFARKQGVFQPSLSLPLLLISPISDFPDLLPRGYKRTPELCMGDGKNSTVSRCC